jgi:hypothetical protein
VQSQVLLDLFGLLIPQSQSPPMNAIKFREIYLDPKPSHTILFRDGLIPTTLNGRHDGVPNEVREMGVSCLAFGLNHGQKSRADPEALDYRVLPFRFVQRGILLCLNPGD